MSIASGTPHYGYPQVQLNDRPTFADFNPAFADIDTKLYGLITGASTDHAAIEALQRGLGETDLLLASVKETADNAKSKADTNAENITLLQTALGNTDRNVATKLDSVAIAEPYDASGGTYNIGDIVVYQGQRYKCTTAVAVAEPFDADKWTGEDVETVLEHLQDEIDDIPTGGAAADVTLAPITGMTADDVQEGIEEVYTGLTGKANKTDLGNDNTTVTAKTNYTVSNVVVKKVGALHFVSFTFTGTIPATSGGAIIASLGVNLPHANTAGTAYVWDGNGYMQTTGCQVTAYGDIGVIAGAAGVSGAVQILYY